MIDNSDAVKLLDGKRRDSVLVATMNANNVQFQRSVLTAFKELPKKLANG